jgi:large subunit ribosomal protein L10
MMKKIGVIFKESSEKKIRERLKDSMGLFIVKYSGVSSPDMSSLRQSLLGSSANLFVVKNSVARIALKGCGLEELLKSIEGPCGLVFTKDEPVGASRILYDFSRGHEKLKLEGGFLKDRIIGREEIEALAKLPSLGVLRAQAVIALKSPITGLVMVLSGTLKKFVYCLEQIKEKKSKSA